MSNTESQTSGNGESGGAGDGDHYELFVQRFAQFEPDLRRFIRSLLPTWTDADEVLQQTAMVIWRKFDQYDPDTHCMKWACVIARFEALAYRRKMARDRLVFREGAVRMQVPPAARGFKLHSPTTEIVDLGTEFGLVVRDGKGQVEVFDGEIALHRDGKDEQLVKKGGALTLAADGSVTVGQSGQIEFPDAKEFGSQAIEQRRKDFARWQAYRDELAGDERLIAYYDFAREDAEALIPNRALPRNAEFDGAVILAEPVGGRWPEMKSALEFRRPGSRMRVNIAGEFPAFTFMAWVRIDSLDRRYNALFMGDGYENGEPHWQIREDGALMLSVMVDDSRPNPGAPNDAGLHRVYFSPPVWDMSMSGEWLHVASVFDPGERAVSHFVNGKQISTQEISDKFCIDSLRIGNAEIGNWGRPFREDPWFAIRNLNGRMDEFAIFREALDESEIAKLFERSRVGGR